MGTAPRPVPPRLRRLGRTLVPAAIVAYLIFAAHQLVTLPGANLEFDFRQFHLAGQDLAAGRDPYATYLGCCTTSIVTPLKGYIYPPLLALLFRPLAGVPEVPAAYTWLVVLHACLVASIVLAYRALRPILSADARRWLLAGALLFPPLLENLGFMQVGTPIILVTVLAGVAYLKPSTTPRAGAWIALGSALRVSPALVGAALLRRERASLQAIVVGLASGGVLLLVMLLATPRLPEFLGRVLPSLGHGSAVFDNEAPAGVALRLDLFVFAGHAAPLRYAGAAVAVVVVVVSLLAGMGAVPTPQRRAAVFATWVGAIPLVSSITWTHHLATELVVFAFLAPSLAFGARAWWLTVLAYPLLWAHRVIQVMLVMLGLHDARDIGGVGLVLLSATGMVGMLLLWAACVDVVRAGRARIQPQPA